MKGLTRRVCFIRELVRKHSTAAFKTSFQKLPYRFRKPIRLVSVLRRWLINLVDILSNKRVSKAEGGVII